MYKRIQQSKTEGKSVSTIAREEGLDRKTTAKYYHMPAAEYRKYREEVGEREKKVRAHEGEILEVYRENEYQRLNMAAVYDYLEERHGGVEYTEKTLRNYIRYLQGCGRLEIKEAVRMSVKVPELPFGRQMQMDFGEYRCRSGLRLYIYSAVLSASRYKYMVFQGVPFSTEDVIGHTLECFAHLGGMVAEVVIDQDALLVVSENAGQIIYTKKFGAFIEEMGLRMYVCRKADPQSKGKVENSIKYVKRNFLSIRDFADVDEANEGLRRWLKRRANGGISQATKRAPAELLETERGHLAVVRNSIFGKNDLRKREQRVVDDHSYVSVAGSLYSVPTSFRGRSVEVYATGEEVLIFDEISGEEVAKHPVAAIAGSTIADRSHFRRTEHSAGQLREEARSLVDLDLWIRFEKLNAKAFPRYVRDQALEAKRRFSGELDLGVLADALVFCLENQTLSYANLNDTYQAFLGQTAESCTPPAVPCTSLTPPTLTVGRRSLEVYQAVVASAGGGR